MAYYKDNKGLEAVQNKDKRMAYENALKSYSAVINGIAGDKQLLRMLLGKDDYNLLKELGLTDFCLRKTEELYFHYPFPDMPEKSKGQQFAEAKAEAPKSQAEQDLADEVGGEEKMKEDEKIKEAEREEEYPEVDEFGNLL